MGGLGDLRALVRDVNHAVHGTPATVTVQGLEPVSTTAIWLTTTPEDRPDGALFSRVDPFRTLALKRSEVPTVPVGTVIDIPESDGGTVESWVVDGLERQEADHNRVIVKRRPESTW